MPVTANQIFYSDTGTGSALVFLHSVTLDSRMWDHTIAETYRLLIDVRSRPGRFGGGEQC